MAIDVSKVFEKYKGQWVAFKEDRKTVVGHGKTAKAALKEAIKNGYKAPILSHLPAKLVNYVGFVSI